MNLLRLINFLRDRLRMVVRVGIAALVVLILLDAVPAIVDKEHAHTAAEHIPAFWAAFGLLGCLLLVIVSKTFGHLGVSTREDYYDR
jgi:Zn-dependent protease with chaperone function